MTGKIYLENPYLKDLKATIIKKEKRDNEYYITLNRTLFYPRNSKIKNIDKGTINGVKVIDVFEEKDDIIHVTEKNICSKEIIIQIDWNTRFDYMQQHTGQHILSAAISKLCGIDTFSFDFGLEHSRIETSFKDLTPLDIARIEKFANHIVYSNFTIKQQKTGMVSIENVNIEPCKGLHCSSTGEVGMIKIIKQEKNERNNINIIFVCGDRALKDYNSKSEIIDKISNILSIGEKDILHALENILEDNRDLKEKVESIRIQKPQ